MKKVTFAILILTISFGTAPGITVSSVQVSTEVNETTKIFSFGNASFSTHFSSLRRKGDLDENERDRLINTDKKEEANHNFKFYSFRNEEKPEEETNSTYFARAPPTLT